MDGWMDTAKGEKVGAERAKDERASEVFSGGVLTLWSSKVSTC